MTHIIPTIFAHNKKEFEERLHKLLPISNCLQIDFMDGKFVKAKSVSLSDIPNLAKYHKKFEAHLMVKNPEKYFAALKKKGFKKIIFHIETASAPEKLIQKIRSLKMNPMIAINPETSLNNLPPNTDVLFMGVHPGKEHQQFIPKVYKKIRQFKKNNSKIFTQVDGGAVPAVIKKLARLKIDAVNSGSYISESTDPKETVRELSK